ncbi:MAG: cold shock domain-containing protein [Leptospira sp.]|jgi:cold shock CspA family protein|nr:cold shock domain-containing protein [Leptospira sp.]
MEASKVIVGKITKYFPFDRSQNKGGFGFVEHEGQELFFNIKYVEIPIEEIKVGLDVQFETRMGFDRKKNEKTTQATKLRYA